MKLTANLEIDRGQWATQMLQQYLPSAPNQIVSDIGAGFGWMRPSIEALGGQWQPFDYVRKIEESRIWDLNQPAPEGVERPGAVIFLEVLEHLANPELGLRHISEHIAPGGYLIMSTPNPGWSRSRYSLLVKNYLFCFQPKHLVEHHVFTAWPHIVEFFLQNLGFEILGYYTLNGKVQAPELGSRNYFKLLLQYGVCRMIERHDPTAIGMIYGLVARKVK
jgi:2-polyprenyl-3-methyl-5-hydroxy-6-metoxy-1,4-benzoquinol methylase